MAPLNLHFLVTIRPTDWLTMYHRKLVTEYACVEVTMLPGPTTDDDLRREPKM
jgi:hypothetical protein